MPPVAAARREVRDCADMGAAWQSASQGNGWIAWLDDGGWTRSLDTFSPMIPALAVEIAWEVRDPEISAARLAHVIGKDPILAVNVVRLANSAFSASATTITSIDQAVVRVGTRAVRQLVMAATLTARLRNPKTYGANARQMVDHCVGTGYLASYVAERLGADPDAAFLYGLLHDIGKFVILKVAHDDKPIPSTMGQARFEACLASRHAAVGARALQLWRFADEIRMPVAWHHEPDLAPAHQQGAAIAYLANRLAHRYGFGGTPEEIDLIADPVFVRAGFDEGFLERLDARAPQLLEVASKIAA
ncbi:MAG: HDOD domain-containing protein [Vicinamibacterales bacterium]